MAAALEEKAMASFAADWPHMLLVCGENRIFFLDYVSYSLKEIDMALLESKQITCIEVFALEDVVAFGGPDGAVRLWHVLTGAVHKLPTTSSKPIVGMFSHYSDMGTFLTAVSEDGAFSKWKVHAASGAAEAITATLEAKESKNSYEVYDATFDSTEHTWVLLTDKGLVVRDYHNDREIARLRFPSSSKTSFVAMQFFAHTRYSYSSALLLPKDGKSLNLCNTRQNSPGAAAGSLLGLPSATSPAASAGSEIDPQTILDASDAAKNDKEKVKFLFFAVHQTNPSLVFIGTSNGLTLAHVDPFSTPHFALVRADHTAATAPPPAPSSPSLTPASASGPKLTSKSSSNAMIVMPPSGSSAASSLASKIFYINDGQLWTISSAGPNERGAVVSIPAPFAPLANGGEGVRIATSPSGAYLSVLYEKLYKYDIYAVDTKKVVDSGNRILGIVWCPNKDGPLVAKTAKDSVGTASAKSNASSISSSGTVSAPANDTFAFLEGPPPHNPKDTDTSKKRPAATTAATRTMSLNVKNVSSSTSLDVIATYDTTATAIARLFPGPLIGVDVKSEPGASDAVSFPSNFQFYNWAGEKIGNPLPTPREVLWDTSSMKYCLFTYDSQFCVFSVTPRFKLLAKVSDVILSSLWFNGCLFYTTRTDLKVFFASNIDSRESVVSATPTDAFSSALLSKSQQFQENITGCSLVEIANDKVVLLTHDYRVVSVLVDNPVTQFYVLAHAGKVTAAVQLANAMIPARHHQTLAKFFEARGRIDAAGQLSLVPSYKLNLFLRHGSLAEARTVFSSMVKQCRAKMKARGVDDETDAQVGLDSMEETRQMLATMAHKLVQAARSAGNVQLVGKVWLSLAAIEPTAYRHLALFYAQNGFTEPLQELYQKLSNEAHHNAAIREEIKFIAVHLSDKLLSDALQAASNSFAEYIVSLHETQDKEAELLEMWNARISTETEDHSFGMSTRADSSVAQLGRPNAPSFIW